MVAVDHDERVGAGMGAGQTVAVFGAYGHTGRFVVAALRERGFTPLLMGRDAEKLRAFAAEQPGSEARQASAADPASFGPQRVLGEFTMADVVTVPSHLAVPEVRTYMSAVAAADLAAPDAAAPAAVDARGRSAQTFVVDVLVRADGAERRAVASGQDIYAVSAPLAVEAVARILSGRTLTTGVASAGALFDAPDFLRALTGELTVEIPV